VCESGDDEELLPDLASLAFPTLLTACELQVPEALRLDSRRHKNKIL